MHWDTITPPNGVTHISVIQDDDFLLFQATPEGYARVHQIVKILDIGRFSFAMNINCWTANVSESELRSLTLEKRQYADKCFKKTNEAYETTEFKSMDVGSGPSIDALFEKLRRSKRCIFSAAKYEEKETQEWTVEGLTFLNCWVGSDDVVKLGWAGVQYAEYQNSRALLPGSKPPSLFAQIIMHSKQVFALHPSNAGAEGRVIFLQTEY